MAQTAVNSGLIRGLTTDSTGAGIANATITLISRATGTAVTRTSNSAGIRAGCIRFDGLAQMPPAIADRTPRDGDQRFTTVTGRRSTIEYAVASVAEKLLPFRRGAAVVSLLTGPTL